jgi:hypothetical protein
MQLMSLLTPVVLLLVPLVVLLLVPLLCFVTAIAEATRLLDVTSAIAMTIAKIANTVAVFVCIERQY